jgi:hypothetical protein
MRTRADARRGGEAAAAQHAALLALLKGPAPELEAALAAIGPPGSAAVLEALSHGGHALLRAASEGQRPAALGPLLRAYGESPDDSAGMLRMLTARSFSIFEDAWSKCESAAVAALLGVYRRAGRAHEALAVGDHRALRSSTHRPDITALLLAEYGEPGSDAVLAALAVDGHGALRSACEFGRARSAALLAAAYGPPGCAALRAAVVEGCIFIRFSFTSLFLETKTETWPASTRRWRRCWRRSASPTARRRCARWAPG